MEYNEPIVYYDRHRQEEGREKVYGEKSLRWVYGHPLGKLTLALLVRRAIFSKFYGWWMNRPASAARIRPFIERYGITEEEMLQKPDTYQHFNDFFYRRLQPASRPLAGGEETVVLPADGRHLLLPEVSQTTQVFAKGQSFDLARLLDSDEEAYRYRDGTLLISRLCPVDYHRFHFPCSGRLGERRLINGYLYSVNPWALRRNLSYLWQNKRVVCPLEDTPVGRLLMIVIGATCVGGIHWSSSPGQSIKKGEEAGYFSFGGSCVMLLFEKGRITPAEDLLEQSARGRETYARMGSELGRREN